MIEVLLLIGFWLIYIFINTAVSVMSKDSLFFVLAHGTLFIIFVGKNSKSLDNLVNPK